MNVLLDFDKNSNEALVVNPLVVEFRVVHQEGDESI